LFQPAPKQTDAVSFQVLNISRPVRTRRSENAKISGWTTDSLRHDVETG